LSARSCNANAYSPGSPADAEADPFEPPRSPANGIIAISLCSETGFRGAISGMLLHTSCVWRTPLDKLCAADRQGPSAGQLRSYSAAPVRSKLSNLDRSPIRSQGSRWRHCDAMVEGNHKTAETAAACWLDHEIPNGRSCAAQFKRLGSSVSLFLLRMRRVLGHTSGAS